MEMVGQNMGISIMLKQQADYVGHLNVVTVPLEAAPALHVYLIYHKQSSLSKIEKEFIKYTENFQNIKF